MASRTPPPGRTSGGRAPGGRAPGGGPAGGGGSRRQDRGRAAPIRKPFPVGFAIGCTVLAVALIAVIVFAVQNQGIGAKGSLKQADQISGLSVTPGLDRNHILGVLHYPDEATLPPDGGNHNPTPQTCQVYTSRIPNEDAVHSLEHGAVWVTYNPSLDKADVAKLAAKVAGNPYRMLSPYPGLRSPVSLQSWGRRLLVSSVGDKRIDTFLGNFTGGPQAPEPGAACAGNTTTGTTPAGGAVSPSPAGTPASPAAAGK